MKIIIKDKASFLIDKINKNRITIVLILVFYLGIIIGSLFFNYSITKNDELLDIFTNGISSESDFGTVFINCTIVNSIYFISIILFGLSSLGKYILNFVPIIKGMSYGYSSGFVYYIITKNSLLANILGILPQTFFSAILIVIGCKISIIYSNNYKENSKENLRNYLIIESTIYLLSIVVSLLDVFVTGPILQIFY